MKKWIWKWGAVWAGLAICLGACGQPREENNTNTGDSVQTEADGRDDSGAEEDGQDENSGEAPGQEGSPADRQE
ncbi:MAG: hypothetical protein HFG25_14230, partial [Lachnospiraceae bacterium]|nr:hypothetical protein [Lachnospiraceae bacterium]